jgi:hypothetical protein
MAQTKRKPVGLRSRAKRLADVVEQVVDDGAKSVEEIHKAIADLPLEMLQRLDGFEDTLKDVRKLQESSIGAIYDAIRKVNHEVARLATEVLARKTPRGRARPAKATKARARAAHAA